MPHFEISQIILGHPEVLTNIKYIEIWTIPFELRKQNTVKLYKHGDAIDDIQHHPPDSFSSGPPMQHPLNENNLPHPISYVY